MLQPSVHPSNPKLRVLFGVWDFWHIDLALEEHVSAADWWTRNKLVCFKLDFLQADSAALRDLLGVDGVADLIKANHRVMFFF